MKPVVPSLSRRDFARTLALAGAGLAAGLPKVTAVAAEPSPRLKLGLDNFAVRGMGWKAPQLIDYAASLKLDTLFISDLDAFESHDGAHLRDLRRMASDKGLELYLGTWSICPTSRTFKDKWGTAEEHLALGIRMATDLGSPVIRVVQGAREDRQTEGGIEARIADTIKVCQACRSRAVDAGIKIAIENHAGDMQARELVTLVEAAGRDYVGVNMDSGNATWTLEDPQESLEILGPYVCCTSLRDSMIWETDNGARVAWTAMGEGLVDWKAYFARFAAFCPQVPVQIETISGFSVEFPYLQTDFWNVWPKALAKDFAKFLAMARKGRPLEAVRPQGREAQQAYQREDLEKSLTYCRTLGLGVRA
ncbi:MAG: sugar phosphate isomerase/epimerase [Verrucomicrobiales bacterium]|nr:sugar phosphate isomerase/epimerase [Verrucomicrobiales bacterium]